MILKHHSNNKKINKLKTISLKNILFTAVGIVYNEFRRDEPVINQDVDVVDTVVGKDVVLEVAVLVSVFGLLFIEGSIISSLSSPITFSITR